MMLWPMKGERWMLEGSFEEVSRTSATIPFSHPPQEVKRIRRVTFVTDKVTIWTIDGRSELDYTIVADMLRALVTINKGFTTNHASIIMSRGFFHHSVSLALNAPASRY
jgi:hypothetical protein